MAHASSLSWRWEEGEENTNGGGREKRNVSSMRGRAVTFATSLQLLPSSLLLVLLLAPLLLLEEDPMEDCAADMMPLLVTPPPLFVGAECIEVAALDAPWEFGILKRERRINFPARDARWCSFSPMDAGGRGPQLHIEAVLLEPSSPLERRRRADPERGALPQRLGRVLVVHGHGLPRVGHHHVGAVHGGREDAVLAAHRRRRREAATAKAIKDIEGKHGPGTALSMYRHQILTQAVVAVVLTLCSCFAAAAWRGWATF